MRAKRSPFHQLWHRPGTLINSWITGRYFGIAEKRAMRRSYRSPRNENHRNARTWLSLLVLAFERLKAFFVVVVAIFNYIVQKTPRCTVHLQTLNRGLPGPLALY